MSDKALTVIPQSNQALDISRPPSVSISQMIEGVLKGGITTETASVVERLAPLLAQERDHNAKLEFNRDFCALMGEMHKVKATKEIPNKNGGVRSTFAPFEEIDDQLRPIAARYGFSYSFSEGAFTAGRITKNITILHRGGHERTTPYSTRIGQGPPGCSESQADGAAHSYAKRGAICDAFNIVVTNVDGDARAEGKPITKEQADDLRKRVMDTGSDEAAFLKYAGATTYEAIFEGRYGELDKSLRRKEKTA